MEAITAPPAAAAFERGAAYSRAAIRAALGGNARAAFPSHGGRVVCVCVTPGMNPEAPRVILVPDRPSSLRLARALAAAGNAVPLFVRRRAGEWECAGAWRVRVLIEEPQAVAAHAAGSGRAGAALALLMEAA